MRVIGVDPGISGGISVIEGRSRELPPTCIYCEHIPTYKTTVNKKVQRHLDIEALANVFCSKWDHNLVVMEDVNAFPGASPISMFKFGGVFFAIQAITYAIEANFYGVVLVKPKVWMKEFDLIKTEKKASRDLANNLFSNLELETDKDINRAESALIALYGWRHYEELKNAT